MPPPNGARVVLRAVVTAGGRVDEAFAAAIGTRLKALAPFRSGTLLDVVLGAIGGAGIADIAVIGDAEIRRRVDGSVRVIAADDDGAVNVARALDAWPAGDDLLFATSDLPFVRDADLRWFLAAAADYDLSLPLAGASAYEAAYPGGPPHITELGGERVANGSVFFIGSRARVAGARRRRRILPRAQERRQHGTSVGRPAVAALSGTAFAHRRHRTPGRTRARRSRRRGPRVRRRDSATTSIP